MISKNSIAVLPFLNMSAEADNEYFSDGITEEIINALCRFNGLLVTSRTSSFVFKNKNLDIREIGNKLGVMWLLEGSVRRSGNKVRITAQLVKASDGFHVWSETRDRQLADIFALQDEMASTLAEIINEKIQPQHPTSEKPIQNTLAIDLYLKGLYLLNQFDHTKSKEIIDHFEQSISLEPNFTKPLVSLCDAYTWLGSIGVIDTLEARRIVDGYIKTLLTIDEDIPDVYAIIAGKQFWMEWNLAKSLENINKALELKPNYTEALLFKGMILLSMGKAGEALDNFFMTERLNPFDQTINYAIGFVYLLTGEFEKSLGYIEKNLDTLPGWSALFFGKLEALCQLNRKAEAFEFLNHEGVNPAMQDSLESLWGLYYGLINDSDRAQTYIQKTLDEKNPGFGAPEFYYIAKMCMLTGNSSDALFYAQKAMEMQSAPMLFARLDYTWDGIRNDKQFIQLMKKLEFDQTKEPTLPGATIKYRKSALNDTVAANLEKKLETLMREQKPWLDPKLNSPDLAEMLDITVNQLSQYLNEKVGRNFFDFVNSYRLQYFKEICHSPEFSHLSILGMAYECGFNAKATFNAFFRKETGITPSEFYRSNL